MIEKNISYKSSALKELYGASEEVLKKQEERYKSLYKKFETNFGGKDPIFFSSPGRTEIGGNHTDHNHGKVLAAAVQLEAAAVAEPCEGRIEVRSGGWDQNFVVELDDLAPRTAEYGKTEALLRGVAAHFQKRGHRWGGFKACVESSVLQGSGLSSSAAFEILTGSILSSLYNDGAVAPAARGHGREGRQAR